MSQEKDGFAKHPTFQSENPVFLWLHRRRLLTLGCWRVFTGYSQIFTAYSRVFDRLAKPVLPPKAGFQCQNRFFWVFAQKPGFCPATHSVSGDGSHIGIYIYLYIYPYHQRPSFAGKLSNFSNRWSNRWSNPLAKRLEPAAKCLMPNLTTGASGGWCSIPSLTPSWVSSWCTVQWLWAYLVCIDMYCMFVGNRRPG